MSRNTRSAKCEERGFWAGMTLYPVSKCTQERAVDMVEIYGPERLLVNSAGELGCVQADGRAGLYLGHAAPRSSGGPDPGEVVYDNPLKFFSQSRGFQFTPPDVSQPASWSKREHRVAP